MLHKTHHPAARSTSSLSPPPSSSSLRRSGSGCKQLERVAGWVSAGLYTAFFTSLDRCSCVKLDTIDNNIMQEPTKPLLLPKRPKSKHLTSSSPIQQPLEPHTPTS